MMLACGTTCTATTPLRIKFSPHYAWERIKFTCNKNLRLFYKVHTAQGVLLFAICSHIALMALPASHEGYFLCMNVAGCTGDDAVGGATKKPRPTRSQAHEAIFAAYQEAIVELGKPPGAVLLQEYTWVDDTLGSIKDLTKGLSKLAKSWASAQDSEDLSYHVYQVVRQYSNKRKDCDTAIVFNTSIYTGLDISRISIDDSVGVNVVAAVGDAAAAEAAGIVSYETRWAGVQLAVPGCGPEKKNLPTALQFLLVSYHGRSNKPKGTDTKGGGRLPSNVKIALARDFVVKVAKAACIRPNVGVLHTAFGMGTTNDWQAVTPALMAGDWNAEHNPAFGDFTSHPTEEQGWSCSSHGPDDLELNSWSRRMTKDGCAKVKLDYVVAINFGSCQEHSCKLDVKKVQALRHHGDHNGLFDHDPLLVSFILHPGRPADSHDICAELQIADLKIQVMMHATRLGIESLRSLMQLMQASFA